MLQAVGHPVAVNPDRDLRRRALVFITRADFLLRLYRRPNWTKNVDQLLQLHDETLPMDRDRKLY